MKLQRYIRLLSYENALKVIDFVENLNVYENYANITPGGVSLQILEKDFQKVLDFITSLNARFEITLEHPSKVEQKIVETVKKDSVISVELLNWYSKEQDDLTKEFLDDLKF